MNSKSQTTPSNHLETGLGDAVDRVVESRVFSRSTQLKQLLLHLREATESGDEARLTETAVGVEFFHRPDFSPKMDTIVRSEMVRLRRKLEEYYAGEGAADPQHLTIGKNVYRLQLAQAETKQEPAHPPRGGFWIGVALGAALAAATAAALWLAMGSKPHQQPVRSSLWSGFANTAVDVCEGSALFFKFRSGHERIWALNTPEDVANARQHLGHWPAIPLWDKWAPFGDVASGVELDRFLRGIGTKAAFLSAREQSVGNLANRRVIVLGHPRFAPLLYEVLAGLDFRSAAPHDKARALSGFLNVHPRPGEKEHYFSRMEASGSDERDRFLLNQVDESIPDYALITCVRRPDGGEVLSVFGDRTESGTLLLHTITSQAFLDDIEKRVFHETGARYRSVQIVMRVDYSRAKPTGVVYLTHRIH